MKAHLYLGTILIKNKACLRCILDFRTKTKASEEVCKKKKKKINFETIGHTMIVYIQHIFGHF